MKIKFTLLGYLMGFMGVQALDQSNQNYCPETITAAQVQTAISGHPQKIGEFQCTEAFGRNVSQTIGTYRLIESNPVNSPNQSKITYSCRYQSNEANYWMFFNCSRLKTLKELAIEKVRDELDDELDEVQKMHPSHASHPFHASHPSHASHSSHANHPLPGPTEDMRALEIINHALHMRPLREKVVPDLHEAVGMPPLSDVELVLNLLFPKKEELESRIKELQQHKQ